MDDNNHLEYIPRDQAEGISDDGVVDITAGQVSAAFSTAPSKGLALSNETPKHDQVQESKHSENAMTIDVAGGMFIVIHFRNFSSIRHS